MHYSDPALTPLKNPLAFLVSLIVILLLMVLLTAAPVLLNAEESSDGQAGVGEALGNVSAPVDISGSAEKQEVIYAALNAEGVARDVNVVNVLSAESGQTVQDFGLYDQVINLTDTSEISKLSDSVVVTMPEGEDVSEFTYQGTMENAQIPWNVSIAYYLDGQEIAPSDLAGKSGHLDLHIETTRNQLADQTYYDNYLMQVTCTFPMDKVTNIKTEQGSIALSGSDSTVSFMVMPEKDGSLSLSADVSDFEMSGISFAAIPFSMVLDLPDTGSLVSQFDSLIEGTAQLDSGTKELAGGASEIDKAAAQAASGASELAAGADSVTQGMQQYQQGLRDQAKELFGSSSQESLEQAYQAYQRAQNEYIALLLAAYQEVMTEDPDLDPEVALQQAIAELSGSKEEAAMKSALENIVSAGSGYFASQGAAQALSSAADGLGSTSDSSSLLGGSASLGAGAKELASGLDQLAGGTGELTAGVDALAEGTQALAGESKGIPDAVQSEIDALMSSYDKSDFVPSSFTSSKNTNVTLVQFVMTTDSIKVSEPEQAEEPEEQKSFLDRLFALFQ